MASNVIGFFGVENYEIILYLSRIMDRMKRKVLLIDYSTADDLTVCIPVPKGIYPDTDIITYFGVDFTRQPLDSELIEAYDVVLISFGFNYIEAAVEECTHIVYAADQQKHNIIKLAALPDTQKNNVLKDLIIKDVVESKINQVYIMDKLQKSIKSENVFMFDQDEVDKKIKILAQHDTLYEFKKISSNVKDYLKYMVKIMCPGITDKDLKAAYKTAERGK